MMDEFQCFSKGLTYISLLSDERVITVGASGMPLIVSSSGKITLDDADDDLSLGLVSDESNGVFYASFDDGSKVGLVFVSILMVNRSAHLILSVVQNVKTSQPVSPVRSRCWKGTIPYFMLPEMMMKSKLWI